MLSSRPDWARELRARTPRSRVPDRPRGQSLVEFALILPVLLLLVLGGIDFGRVFLGWVSLNNTARIAANYAASNASLMNAGNAAALATYNDLVKADATTTNCQPPDPIPAPTFNPGVGIGSNVTVGLSCEFGVITPIIGSLLGSKVTVSASAVFPVRTGVVAGVPGGGSPAPVARFDATPASGDAPLSVHFTNQTTGSASSYAWDYEDDGTIDSTDPNPPDHVYGAPGSYTARLTVSNGLASSTTTRSIDVSRPPGPIADFTLTPPTGTAPLPVTITDASTGAVTSWAWDLDGNGSTDSILQDPPQQTYVAGTWSVTLTVTDDLGQSSTTSKQVVATPAVLQCQVPDFKNQNTADNIQQQWTNAGFQTIVIFNPSRPPEFKITKQSLAKGSNQPCATTVITVFDR